MAATTTPPRSRSIGCARGPMASPGNTALVLCLLATLLLTVTIGAQGPIGDEFQVNTTAAGDQRRPAVATAPDGRFVVVWHGPRIRARRFDAQGEAVGMDFIVDDEGTRDVNQPDVAIRPDGSFLVVWQEGRNGIEGRLFDANAQPLTGDIAIATDGGAPVADARSDGGFVVAFTNEPGTYYAGIQGQQLDAQGDFVGGAFFVAGYAPSESYPARPRIAVHPNDRFVVTWDDSVNSVSSRRFLPDGTPNGASQLIHGATSPALARGPDNGFVVAWRSNYEPRIELSRFDVDATPLGPPVVVGPVDTPAIPAVFQDTLGNITVAWRSDELAGRVFAADGLPLGQPFILNANTRGDERAVGLDTVGAGRLVAIWSSTGTVGDDTDGTSIHGRFVSIPRFGDGFESGDLSRWTTIMP